MDGHLLNPATPRSSRLRERSDECGSSVQWKAVPGILLFASVTAILIWQGNLDARADIKPEPGSGDMELYSPSWSSVRKLGSWPRLNISELRVNAGRFTMVSHDCPTLRWEVLPQASASTPKPRFFAAMVVVILPVEIVGAWLPDGDLCYTATAGDVFFDPCRRTISPASAR